ncbi:uncharacterized protein LOC131227735 [Magnolia sinica]|uniref:uncharacterized protein LOC131227735 n=1 Tax=Magnolia sinica TaxID=86752 RepID=UPI0026591393|nr:uncharacterized protein LOC131227735 [Magnolia sinica]
MANFLEEIALEDQRLEGHGEKIRATSAEPCNQSNRSNSSDGDADEGNIGSLPDSVDPAEFWQSSYKILKEILADSRPSGSKLRKEVDRAVMMARKTAMCHCQKATGSGCASCLRQVVVDHLHTIGYDAATCTSKWRSTREIPGGKHEYIDVIVQATDCNKHARFVIELEFRSEFEMAKACDEYRNLINQLPESYVGKPEYLNAILGIVCEAGKKSMKEMKIHMGPWRKRRFMEMKWSGPHRRWSFDQSHIGPVRSKDVGVPVIVFGPRFFEAPAMEVA